MIRRHRRSLAALALLGCAVFVADVAAARTARVAFVDDDWDPIERGVRNNDPGFEVYILEALDILGYDTVVYEIQPDSGPPHLPQPQELASYPLVIWNCGAETDIALSYDERQLLRYYRSRGGKLMLLGQGILNSFDKLLRDNPNDEEVLDFLHNVIGVADYGLDMWVQRVIPDHEVPYLDQLGSVPLETDGLPVPDPTLGDVFFPEQGFRSLLTGYLQSGSLFPVASNQYLPRPLHFQSVLMEAIADPYARAAYIDAYARWLGFEGDDLMDFMSGPEALSLADDCPPHSVQWSSALNAMTFESWGSAVCDTRWKMSLQPSGSGCPDWTIRQSHQITDIGYDSEMVLLELLGGIDLIRVSAFPAPNGGPSYYLRYTIISNGETLEDQLYPSLPPGETVRLNLSQSGPDLEFSVLNADGYVLGLDLQPGYVPDFETLSLIAVGHEAANATPIRGWIDDLSFEGCLALSTTEVDETPAATARIDAFPNPFNPSTHIRVELGAAGPVDVAVHDLLGRRVRTLARGDRPAGLLELDWDGRDDGGQRLGSGVYLLRVTDGEGSRAAKLVMLK